MRKALAAVMLLMWLGQSMSFFITSRVSAGGPLSVTSDGRPLIWRTDQPVPFTPDQGPLGRLSNNEAVAFTEGLFQVWEDVPTAAITFVQQGQLSVDVTGANVMNVLNQIPSNESPIIFDADGSITDALFGMGARRRVLGFAGPTSVSGGRVVRAQAVLNGAFIDGRSDPFDISLELFKGVFIHEFGHYIGLDHSQINFNAAVDTGLANDVGVPTMLPFAFGDAQATLHLDDMAAVSSLYPDPSLAVTTGSISGQVLLPDGQTGFQGANVIARKVDDPNITAVSSISGFLFPGGPNANGDESLRGFYEIRALPPGDYTVEVDTISPFFTGGSGVGPVNDHFVPAPPEFYSGAQESNNDDPAGRTAIHVTAGSDIENVNIILNGVRAATNDNCLNPIIITGSTFRDTIDTSRATASRDDPVHSTTGRRDSSTVWYSFTPTANGTVTVDTVRSNYDTVLSAYTGSCGALTEVAGSDDFGGFTSVAQLIPQARISFNVVGGIRYVIQVASAGNFSMGGQLGFDFWFETAAGGADLVVSDLHLDPDVVSPAESLNVSFTIVNQGDQVAPPTTHIIKLSRNRRIAAFGVVLASIAAGSLRPGEAATFIVSVSIPADNALEGQFIAVIADVGGDVRESVESNNAALTIVTIQ
ncbi:MAG: hypothetical protein HY314_02630 [Acidobacteria bacterium]|nr:hypothetical protein [Acidobacteriota bacterium]